MHTAVDDDREWCPRNPEDVLFERRGTLPRARGVDVAGYLWGTDVDMAMNVRSIGVNFGVGVGSHTDPVGWGCPNVGAVREPPAGDVREIRGHHAQIIRTILSMVSPVFPRVQARSHQSQSGSASNNGRV